MISVNADENSKTANKFKIQHVPSFIWIVDGGAYQVDPSQTVANMEHFIDNVLNKKGDDHKKLRNNFKLITG